MFKKLFGSNKSVLSNAEVEAAMTTVDGEKLAESDDMLLYGGFQELNDYLFFEALFVSKKSFKSMDGATISFKNSNGKDLTLPSSIQEFECDYAKPLQRHIAQISFDIEKKDIKKIQAKAYDTVEFKVKKKIFNLTNS